MGNTIENPSGPFGQAAQDRREWDAMNARQQAAQERVKLQTPQVEHGDYTKGTDFHGN